MTVTESNSGRRADAALQQRLAPSRLGQATAVEQSRAIAEVQAAIVVAQQCPRNVSRAIDDMRESCRRKELADRAFFRFPKGGKPVTGPSIHLARELARVWGNIQYGVAELRRDDEYGQSELLAFAWDVQTNSRCSSVFINPHRLYSGGKAQLTELRDIYDNNANVGARRVREAIFAVLPAWFAEEAQDLCARTVADGGGIPLPQRVANAIEVFGNLGITVPQLEAKVGAPSGKWTDQDVAQLRIIRQSLMRGEVRKEEEFPPARVTAAEITGQRAAQDVPGPAVPDETPATGPAAGPGTPKPKGQPAPPAMVRKMEDLIAQLQLGPPPDVDELIRWLCPGYTATRAEVKRVTDHLADHLDAAGGDIDAATDNIWRQMKDAQARDAGEPAGDGDG